MIRATIDTVAELEPFREQLAKALEGTTTQGAAEEAIDAWAKELGDSDALAKQIFENNLMQHMAGQLFVHDIEVGQTSRKLADERPPTFLLLPFDEAIAHFEAREVMDAEGFAALTDAERARAFAMSQVSSEVIRDQAKTLLDTSMRDGGVGLRGFIRQIRADEAALGFTPSSPGYLENVYRTSTATSYNAGRLAAQTSPDVVAATGFWRYVTAGDDRVRDEHAELEGKQWPIGDPEALEVYPPNGYQCRCVMVTVDAEDVDPAELEREIDVGDAVTEGFRAPPTDTIEAGV